MAVKTSRPKSKTHLTSETLLSLYKNIVATRYTDQKMLILIKQGKSFFHIGASGHEAIQTAMAFALQPGYDWAFPYYRDLSFVLQYGVKLKDIFLNFLARRDDPSSGGRQMPNHYGHRGQRIVTQSSPTGTQFLQAVGCALGAKKEGKDEVVYVSSGEGTTAQGDFHEAVNWAAKDKLPVIFVIQNNKYAISVHVNDQVAGGSIYNLVSGYKGLNRLRVDGTDLIKSYQMARKAVEFARSGQGPSLIEAETVRLLPHSSSDSDKKYRSKTELEKDKKNDPLNKYESYLIKEGILSQEKIADIRRTIKEEVDLAAEQADKCPHPSIESLNEYLFAPDDDHLYTEVKPATDLGEPIVMVDAINHALKEEMHRDNKIFLFGQDVADNKGGVFTATTGISSIFGSERCFNAPLAESSIVGVAIGMALRGLKPVIEIQFGDYIWTAMMQIRNELATIRWRSYNNWHCPVIIRVPVGGYIHGGLCHSQNIEGFFSHIPGLKIAYPSRANDAKGLLKQAIRGNDPVLFLEHKGLYRQSYSATPEPDDDYILPFGEAFIRREGRDISLITYGALVQKSLEAAKILHNEGIETEVIDIRTIYPLDFETIIKSIKKTNKVLVAHEDNLFQGFGAEIVSQVTEHAFQYLDAPVRRVAGKDVPVGYNSILENATLPQTEDLLLALRFLMAY